MPDTTQEQSGTMQGDVDQEARDAATRLGLDLNEIKGTGKDGAVTRADVEAHAKKSEGTSKLSGEEKSRSSV